MVSSSSSSPSSSSGSDSGSGSGSRSGSGSGSGSESDSGSLSGSQSSSEIHSGSEIDSRSESDQQVINNEDTDVVSGLKAEGCRAACGDNNLEFWLVRAPKGFDMQSVDKVKFQLAEDGSVVPSELGGSGMRISEGNFSAAAQTVMFLPSGSKDGEMVVAKPFVRQVDILEGLKTASKKDYLEGVTHAAYARVPQIKLLEYKLNERLYTARTKRKRDDESNSRTSQDENDKKTKLKKKKKRKKKNE